ncbi:MAG: hypothetical protein WKF34_12860 [Pyrinomonadaceae bacterium]
MLKRYTFWLTAAVLFQLLTAAIHAISLFMRPSPAGEAERQMMELVFTLRLDAGSGFRPTLWNMFTAVSACLSLLCFLGGSINGWLLYKHAEPDVMKGILGINVAVFGLCFLVMIFFTFLPPILLSGLIFINLLAAFIVLPKIEVTI